MDRQNACKDFYASQLLHGAIPEQPLTEVMAGDCQMGNCFLLATCLTTQAFHKLSIFLWFHNSSPPKFAEIWYVSQQDQDFKPTEVANLCPAIPSMVMLGCRHQRLGGNFNAPKDIAPWRLPPLQRQIWELQAEAG